MNDPELDLSRIADGIQRIASVVAPKPVVSPDLETAAEVVSVETGAERISGEIAKCVTYTISSVDHERKSVRMSIRFLLKEDPEWSAGQRIRIHLFSVDARRP